MRVAKLMIMERKEYWLGGKQKKASDEMGGNREEK